jgi:hypothetical protein
MSKRCHTIGFFLSSTVFQLVSCGNDVPRDRTRSHDVVSARVFEPIELIDHGQWREYPAAKDPLADHQPANVECGPAGWYVESAFEVPLLEIDTNYCNYAFLEHPSLSEVMEGDTIAFELRHYDLRASEPAEAHVAILFGDQMEWETHIPIPSDANVQTFEWPASRALLVGEPIRLHLHNHGQNTWVIASLRVVQHD